MPAVLSSGIFSALKYLPAILPDNNLFTNLAGSVSDQTIFDYTNLEDLGQVVSLRSLQAASVAGVRLTLQAQGYSERDIDSAALGLWNPFDPEHGQLFDSPTTSQIRAAVSNTNAGASANWWASWTTLVEDLTIAQKLKFKVPLSGPEQAIAQQAGLSGDSPRGVLPRRFEWIRDNEYATQIRMAAVRGATKSIAGGTGNVQFVQENAKQGEILVLRGIASSPGSGADGLKVVIGIDGNASFLTIPAYPLGTGKPLPLFIQAKSQVQIFGISTTTPGSDTSISASIWHVGLTPEIDYRIGNAVPTSVADKIHSGVL